MPKSTDERTFINADLIPAKASPRTQRWIDLLVGVPKGKALVLDLESHKTSEPMVRAMVKRLITRGFLPETYTVRFRVVNGKRIGYVINKEG